jgi:hypothetical protein
MTEEQLKQTWCPFARSSTSTAYSNRNRDNDGKPTKGAMCIGSQCAAYRVTPDTETILGKQWVKVSKGGVSYCGLVSNVSGVPQ